MAKQAHPSRLRPCFSFPYEIYLWVRWLPWTELAYLAGCIDYANDCSEASHAFHTRRGSHTAAALRWRGRVCSGVPTVGPSCWVVLCRCASSVVALGQCRTLLNLSYGEVRIHRGCDTHSVVCGQVAQREARLHPPTLSATLSPLPVPVLSCAVSPSLRVAPRRVVARCCASCMWRTSWVRLWIPLSERLCWICTPRRLARLG